MTITRTTIYASHRSSEVMSELKRLEETFLRVHKRRHIVDIFFSSWGGDGLAKGSVPTYGLTVYSEAAQAAETEWLVSQVNPSTAALTPTLA